MVSFILLLVILHQSLGWSNGQANCTASINRANNTVSGPVNVDVDPLTPNYRNHLSALNGTSMDSFKPCCYALIWNLSPTRDWIRGSEFVLARVLKPLDLDSLRQ
jgi:hypothetical protein